MTTWGFESSIFSFHSPKELTHVYQQSSSSPLAAPQRSSPLAIPPSPAHSKGIGDDKEARVASTWPLRTSIDDLFDRQTSSVQDMHDVMDMVVDRDRFPHLPPPSRRVSAPASFPRDRAITRTKFGGFAPDNDEMSLDSPDITLEPEEDANDENENEGPFSMEMEIDSLPSTYHSAPEVSNSMELSHTETSYQAPAKYPKLSASKSPIMEALVYCAMQGWGLRLTKFEGSDIQFVVDDFDLYYEKSALICAKQNPTEALASRIKALKRWFPLFPCKSASDILKSTFTVKVAQATPKDNKPKKLATIIKKIRKLVAEQNKNRE